LIAPDLDAVGLQALAEKYSALLQAREYRDAGGSTAKDRLAALAKRFPGALRELDRNPADVLRMRLHEVQAALSGGPTPRWAHWVWTYHHLLAHALDDPQTLGPGGQRSQQVLKTVAEYYGIALTELAETLFPRRR
jgi:hypothetical protein